MIVRFLHVRAMAVFAHSGTAFSGFSELRVEVTLRRRVSEYRVEHHRAVYEMKNRSNLEDELFYALSPQGQACAVRAAHPRKERHPVAEATTETMWDHQYQAKHPDQGTILACDSLPKLKQAVRLRRWRMAWITTSNGMLSYGQNVIHEYPYVPRYG
ncbi:hypothetical protein [Paraburkholderia fungorum]|uniref:hypothetical protein n=1 Tax=Paraburkholderia fungorum TaxID=134537 RepID=UPI000FD7C9F2|nr:hypothetical protein [Paraburkholderia fungorum]